MSEHIAAETIKRYFNRKLKPDELFEADEHLARCDSCLRKAADLGEIEKIAGFFLRSAPDESAHLSYEQLESCADEKSDAVEREIADVHLETCAGCRASLDELFETKKLIAADLQKQILTRDEKSVFSKIGNIFSEKYFLRFGFAAAAVLIFASIFIWLVNRDSQTEVAEIPAPSSINSPILLPENSPANTGQNINTEKPDNTNSEINTNSKSSAEDETEKFPPQHREEIRRTLAENRLNFPAELNGLKSRSGTLMSGGGSETVPFALSNPVGKIILSDTPQFQWKSLAGAQNYIVNVYDENFNAVASSPQISATNWRINKPLARNKIYIWQVTAFKDGEEIKSPVRPAPDARFKILDAKRADELSRLSRQHKGEHLFLGIMYARAGLLNEAENEFEKELAKNPNSKPARRFLQEVRARRK